MENASNTPSLRFRGYTDAWGQETFGDILTVYPFKPYIAKPKLSGEYPVIQQGDNPILGYADGEPFRDYKNVVLFGDHTVSLYKPESPFFLATDGIKTLGSKTKFEGNFLYSLLEKYKPESEGYKRHFSMLKEQECWFPNSIEEQHKIGCVFNELDSLLSLHQRKLDKLQAIKKSLLQKMFPAEGEDRPQIRFAGYTDAWGQERLGDMGETFTGLSGKSKEDFGHGNAKFVTYMNVYLNPIADLKMLESVEVDNKQTKVQYGDMFFTTSSETPEEVGMSSIWLGNIENLYLNSFCFGYRLSKKMDPYFMGYLMRSPEIRNKFIFLAQGISRYNISKNHVMEMEVAFPSLEEQKKIGQLLYSVDSLLSLHQRKLEKLQQIKKALLEQMFC